MVLDLAVLLAAYCSSSLYSASYIRLRSRVSRGGSDGSPLGMSSRRKPASAAVLEDAPAVYSRVQPPGNYSSGGSAAASLPLTAVVVEVFVTIPLSSVISKFSPSPSTAEPVKRLC